MTALVWPTVAVGTAIGFAMVLAVSPSVVGAEIVAAPPGYAVLSDAQFSHAQLKHPDIVQSQFARAQFARAQFVQAQFVQAQAPPAKAAPVATRKKAPDKPAETKPNDAKPSAPSAGAATIPTADPPAQPQPPPPEAIEIDVSTRNVAITSTFSGTEIVVFGSVDNSRQQIAGSSYYDVVVVVDGATAPAVVREKKRMFGIWVNADRMRFETLPLYRAVASSRPLEEIADPAVLASNRITLEHYMRTSGPIAQREAFGAAATRLKRRDGLYVSKDYGAAFLGRSLFRAGVKLPANIPVGPLEVRVLLLKDGQVLSSRVATVRLEREGLERLIYDFAYEQPFWYGVLAVAMALGAGLIGSAVFQRQSG